MIARYKIILLTNLSLSTIFVSAALMMQSAYAYGIDLHWLWDDRCADCHGHAGDFARKFLNVYGNELQGRHHVHDLRRFLYYHYLSGHEVDSVYGMLLAQAKNEARFKNECSDCHENAAQLVRNTQILSGGVLYSRLSGNDIRNTLEHHRHLESVDVDFYVNLLMRVAYEIYRP